MARAVDPKKLRHPPPNGRRPPSPFLANKARYGKLAQKRAKSSNGINWGAIKLAILLAPLILGILVALTSTF